VDLFCSKIVDICLQNIKPVCFLPQITIKIKTWIQQHKHHQQNDRYETV